MSTPESITAIGFTLFWPAYLGALPCVASNTAPAVPMLAPGASPRPPIMPAPRSEMMSPYRLGQTSTSYSLGRRTSPKHELHAHVVDDAVLELDVRVALGDLPADGEVEPVRVLHDVGLVHERHL